MYGFLCGHQFLIPLGRYQEHNCWIGGKSVFSFVKKLPNCLPKWLYHSAFTPETNESSVALHSRQHLALSVSEILATLRRYAVESSCFNLHFPWWQDVELLFTYLFLPIYFVWWGVIKDLWPIFYWVVFLLWSFRSSLHILDNSLLSDRTFANIFSLSVACLILLMVIF